MVISCSQKKSDAEKRHLVKILALIEDPAKLKKNKSDREKNRQS